MVTLHVMSTSTPRGCLHTVLLSSIIETLNPMNMIKKAALAAAVAGSVMSAGAAEAANIFFTYTFNSDPTASLQGVVQGDIVGNLVENINLAGSAAEFRQGSTQIPLTFNSFNPFSLDTNNPLEIVLTLTDANGDDAFFVDTSASAMFAGALSVGNSIAITDTSLGVWNTITQPGSATPIPTPALLPGLLAMGAAARRRLNSKNEAA